MSWQVVYAHDGSGARVSGDRDALRKAIDNGAPVRVQVQAGGTWRTIPCSQTFVADDHVFGQAEIWAININTAGASGTPAGFVEFSWDERQEPAIAIFGSDGLERVRVPPSPNTYFNRLSMRWCADI